MLWLNIFTLFTGYFYFNTFFYFYNLSLNINNLELKSKIQAEIQQLTALRNELVFKNDEIVEQATQKILHNEKLKNPARTFILISLLILESLF